MGAPNNPELTYSILGIFNLLCENISFANSSSEDLIIIKEVETPSKLYFPVHRLIHGTSIRVW